MEKAKILIVEDEAIIAIEMDIKTKIRINQQSLYSRETSTPILKRTL